MCYLTNCHLLIHTQGSITFNDNGTRPENIILLQQYRIPGKVLANYLNKNTAIISGWHRC